MHNPGLLHCSFFTGCPLSHQIKSYACRGRPTKAQKQALTNAGKRLLVPELPLAKQWPWASGRRLCVEIGCGTGESLVDMAARQENWAFICVDVYAPGLGKLLARTDSLPNLRVLHGDHKALFSLCLDVSSIDIVLLLFPDPWPKTRHHKRRLINQPLLELLGKYIKPGGELWIATDWQNYAEAIIGLMAAQPNWQPVLTAPTLTRSPTSFEHKAIEAARCIFEQRWRYTGGQGLLH